jgi:hypothetical protein
MKAKLILVVASTLAVAPAGNTQNLVEYSTLSTNRATSASRLGSPKAPVNTGGVAKSTAKDVASREKSAPGKSQPVSSPTPPAVFILSNGDRLESSHYLLTVDSLRLQQDGGQRTIPLSAVNLEATLAANHERGVDLQIPKNKDQIMLGF